MLNDPKVARLLEQLTAQDCPAVEPVFAPRSDGWIGYPLVEQQLGYDSEDAVRLLEDLTRLGYLAREFHDRIQFCPACNSINLKPTALCPKCQSAHIVRKRMLQHTSCGYAGPAESFGQNGPPVCPKCRTELALLGNDYHSQGAHHYCGNCGMLVDQPVDRWACRDCCRTFARDDLRELVMYRYTANEPKLSRLRVEQVPKARVREFLQREGYEIREKVQLVGRSGAEHELDLIATKRSGPLEHRIVVGFASADREVDSEEVIKLYAKAYDVDAENVVLVATPRLGSEAQHFAQHYHMKVIEADQLAGSDVALAI